jgi:hypothetical protein
LLPWVCLECRDEPVEFILRWPPVSFVALSNESRQRNARKVNAFRRNDDPVDGSGVGEDRFDVSEIDSQRYGTCSFARALLSEMDQRLAIELLKPQSSKASLKEIKARGLGPPDALAYFLEVFAMKANEIAECPGLAAADRGLAAVYAPLDFERPLLGVLATEKGVVDVLPLPSKLGRARTPI